MSPAILFDASLVFRGARDYESALQRAKRAAELNPTRFSGRFALAYLYLLSGMETQALEEVLRLPLPPQAKELVRTAYRAEGPRGVVRTLLELEIERTQKDCTNDPLFAAEMSAVVGDRDRMFDCLHVAQDLWARFAFLTDPLWEDYRSDPRFAAILEQMGLEQYAGHRARAAGGR